MSIPPEASPDWCHSCLKLEPLPDDYYIACGECGHVYVTAEDLVNAYVDEYPGYRPKAEHIPSCAKCWHDF